MLSVWRLSATNTTRPPKQQGYTRPSSTTSRTHSNKQRIPQEPTTFPRLSIGPQCPSNNVLGADVVNFLSTLKHDHKLQLGTLKSIRTGIAHLHDDSRSISSHPLINIYFDSVAKQSPPVPIHKPQVDLTPSMIYARSIVSSPSTSVSLLQKKLAFLLAMAAFLRPSDLARIPFDSCKVDPSDDCMHFKAASPKERRKKRRIIKDFRVHPHQDKELCPIFCFLVLRDHPWMNGGARHSTLFVKANNVAQPVTLSTISFWLHRHFISLSTT